jgi:hypothetical protein
LWSCSAPATISEADAEPPFTSTTICTFLTPSGSFFSASSRLPRK